jgi:hypothetical protein
MAIRDKIRAKALPQLEPGEQVQAAFAAQTASQYLMVLGVVPFLLTNKYRCVVVTDRRIALFDAGRWSMGNPKSLIASFPRATPLGPASGLWHTIDLGGQTLRVHKRFHSDITEADRLLSPLGRREP